MVSLAFFSFTLFGVKKLMGSFNNIGEYDTNRFECASNIS